MLNNVLLSAATPASSIVWLVILIGLVIAMLVMPSITQKKRIKAYEEMKSRLRSGDKVQTIGGIVGRIVFIKDETIVIETSKEKTKIRFQEHIKSILEL